MAIKSKSAILQRMAKSKWNTRKLIGFTALFVGSLLLCFTSKASGPETFDFWVWLFVIYVAGNVGTKMATPEVMDELKTALKTSLSRKIKRENK
jgi:hypothetical protein